MSVKSDGIDTTIKTNYTYEYDIVIFETDSSENYIWNVQGINFISRQINGEMFYCMYNAHADIIRMVDENGELAEKYYYDEWGVETENYILQSMMQSFLQRLKTIALLML